MKKYLFVVFLLVLGLSFMVGCGETTTTTDQEEKTPELELFLDEEMFIGDEAELSYNVFYAKAEDITWKSNNTKVVKVEDGKIYALAAGRATVTATVKEVTKSIDILVKGKKISLSFELNGGVCVSELPEEREEGTSIVLPIPTKEGYNFVGWYGKADFSGEAYTESNDTNKAITKFFAKWEEKTYKVIYHFTGSDNKTTTEEVNVAYSQDYTLVVKSVADTEAFSGWFKDDKLVYEVKTIKANSMNDASIDVYGKAVLKTATVQVKLDYVDGSEIYQSRDAVLAEFLKDYNYIIGKTYTSVKQIGTSASTPLTFHTFYNGTTADGVKCNVKWKWLAEYLYDTSKANLSADNYNVVGLASLLSGSFENTDNNKKGVSVAFRSFLNAMEIGSSTLVSVNYSDYSLANGFWGYLAKAESKTVTVPVTGATFPTIYKEKYTFAGWYRDEELTSGPVTVLTSDCTLYAKFDENYPVTEVTIGNKTTETLRFDTYQLEYSIKPAEANITKVVFSSSDPTVATISDTGLITAYKAGKTFIRVTSKSQSGAYDEFELEIYAPNYFDVSYKTTSYVVVGESIELNAKLITRTGEVTKMNWMSLDTKIATVSKGVVTGVSAGYVKIRAMANGTADYFDFGVTVLSKNAADIVKFVAESNSDNIFLRYDLNIGYTYDADIIGSVSNLLFNRTYTIDRSLEETAAADKDQSGKKPSNEFVCVHYTGNMGTGANAKANARYLSTNNNGVSIHYATGNDGIFHCIADDQVAWHAGDGHDPSGFYWRATGVKVQEGDPEYPVWGISENSKFTINGRETNQSVPTGSTEETKKVTGNTFMYKGVENKCINDMGLAFDIIDGEYYMGTTWWCYSQVKAGRICNKGGNSNSIGIESCVDKGSDIWLTWQITAQLVAHLMQENNLDITRVWGHHFYTAKDCPQPMLANELECWWEFIELVKSEYELLTKYSNYELTFSVVEGKNVTTNGRVKAQTDGDAQLLTYKVVIKDKTTGKSESITLSSILESVYTR